jgi:transcriptional regulator with XRE-family HTH domain
MKDSLKEAFGWELREARRALDLSQEELAFSVDLHRTYISLLERGMKSPTLDIIFRLCKVLQVNPGDFISRINERVSKQTE